MTKNFYPLMLGLGLMLGSGQLHAQSGSEKSYDLLFQTGTIKPTANAETLVSQQGPAMHEIAQGKYFRLVQFYQIPSVEQRKNLEAAGIVLHDYMPHNAYFASIRVGADPAVLVAAGVRAVIEITPALKLSEELHKRDYPAHAMVGNTNIELVVEYFASISAEDAEAMLRAKQVQIVGRNDFSKTFTLQVPVAKINELASLPFVSYVEPIGGAPEPDNLVGATSHRSNLLASDLPMGRKYNGLGVVISEGDGGRIGAHIDVKGRYTQHTTFAISDHAEHVSGTIMGAGNLDPKARGMAFGATLRTYRYGEALTSAPSTYVNNGVRITTHSWSSGNQCNSIYNSDARTADMQVRQMPSLIHVFSAGNAGTNNCNYGAGNVWGNITGGYKQNKNSLAVANLTFTDGINTSSSRGPARDGRVKPEISAVGTDVYSTISPQTYDSYTGTSMSTPGVAGTLAQLYQAYRDLNNQADPESALIKAIVLNTADDIGNPGPDFKHGYGRINALRAVKAIENNTFIAGSATQGSIDVHTITVPAGTKQMRVMVYWSDYEASANAAIALVNNLNMQVTDPTSMAYDPWVLNHAPNATTLDAPAVRNVDNLNNIEQVTIDDPIAGSYLLTVEGVTVPQGPQTYYVVYTMLQDEIEIIYPVGGEGLVPGTQETIRWDAFGTAGTFTAQYSSDNGATWNNISTSIPGTARHRNWIVPPTITTGQALVRVSRNGISDESDAPFTIVRTPANIDFAYICPDSLLLQWQPVVGASGYVVHRLGAMYMDSIGTTTSTALMVYGTNPTQDDWFSVKALTPDGGIGRRANAVKKPLGSLNCSVSEVALLGITSPVSGCYTGSNSDLCLSIQNNGTTAISNIPVSISIDNASPVIHTISNTIAAGATLNYCFPDGMYVLPTTGPVTITAIVAYPGDVNPGNNQQSVTVTLLPAPAATISSSASDMTYTFTSAPAGASSYSWNFGDGNTSSLPDPVHTYAAGGTYTVTLAVTGSNGCVGMQTSVLSVVSGLNTDQVAKLEIYPNPTNGILLLQWDAQGDETATVEVSTIHGQIVLREIISGNQTQLNLSPLADGPYVVKLTNSRVSAVSRVMLQR